MKKQDIIRKVAQKTGVTQRQAKLLVDATLTELGEASSKGDALNVRGLGTVFVEQKGTQRIAQSAKHQVASRISKPINEIISTKIKTGKAQSISDDPDKTNDPGEFIRGDRE
ncbi:HU family DNA-binding protein [Vibrio parahaemolyticus]